MQKIIICIMILVLLYKVFFAAFIDFKKYSLRKRKMPVEKIDKLKKNSDWVVLGIYLASVLILVIDFLEIIKYLIKINITQKTCVFIMITSLIIGIITVGFFIIKNNHYRKTKAPLSNTFQTIKKWEMQLISFPFVVFAISFIVFACEIIFINKI